MDEVPEYVIRPNAARMLMPQLVITIALAIVFYVGIAINVYLLGITIPGTIKILIASVLALLIIIQGMLTYVQVSKTQYTIYKNRIQIGGTKPIYIMFNAVQELKQKKTFFDRMFNTGTIILAPNLRLNAVSNFDQVFNYINQVLQYSRTQYMQA